MTKEEYEEYAKNTNDSELIMLYHEENEDAKNLLYYKYKFIIDILISKYHVYLKKLNVDYQEIYSECNVGFSDGIIHYQEDKDTSLPTFITFCVERRLKGIIRKYNRKKYQNMNETFSLDMELLDSNSTLLDTLRDEKASDPLTKILEEEGYEYLIEKIKQSLTQKEYEVFLLLNKGMSLLEISKILSLSYKKVDNTIQRVKNKIKNILNNKNKK